MGHSRRECPAVGVTVAIRTLRVQIRRPASTAVRQAVAGGSLSPRVSCSWSDRSNPHVASTEPPLRFDGSPAGGGCLGCGATRRVPPTVNPPFSGSRPSARGQCSTSRWGRFALLRATRDTPACRVGWRRTAGRRAIHRESGRSQSAAGGDQNLVDWVRPVHGTVPSTSSRNTT